MLYKNTQGFGCPQSFKYELYRRKANRENIKLPKVNVSQSSLQVAEITKLAQLCMGSPVKGSLIETVVRLYKALNFPKPLK